MNRPISLVGHHFACSAVAVLIFSRGKCVGVAENSVAWRHQAGVDRRSVVRDRSQLLNWFFDPHNVTNAWPRLFVLNAESRWNEMMPIETNELAFNFLHSLSLERNKFRQKFMDACKFFPEITWYIYCILNKNNWLVKSTMIL